MRRIVFVIAAVLVGAVVPAHGLDAQPGNGVAPFLGRWCAQGDPNRVASITANGPADLSLTNENGSTSPGFVSGPAMRQITAPAWNLVQGNLSADAQTIAWSNNTFWARCPDRRFPNVQGTWYVGGDFSRACRIMQNGASLRLRNESGQTATGAFVDRRRFQTNWSGTTIVGTLSRDQNRIDWSNGTYWTR